MKRNSEKERFDARCHAIDLDDLSILCWEVAARIPQGYERDRFLNLSNACKIISAKIISWADREAMKARRGLWKHD